MIERKGDIWDFYYEAKWIVITTNIGWKKDGTNPMGAGIAKQAADMFPDLPEWYGERCRKYGSNTAVAAYDPARFFLFPTKPLDEDKPWMSWQSMSSIALIKRSAKQLVALVNILNERNYFINQIGIPLVGCENGGLRPKDVLPVLHEILDHRFTLFSK